MKQKSYNWKERKLPPFTDDYLAYKNLKESIKHLLELTRKSEKVQERRSKHKKQLYFLNTCSKNPKIKLGK